MKTILLVDDNEDLLETLSRILSAYFNDRNLHDYKILTATSADDAIAILKEETSIQIVFTDIMMPGMDGVELLKHIIHGICRGIQVVMITGQCDTGMTIDSFKNGAAEYITKPCNASTIYEVMDRTIARLRNWTKIIREATWKAG